MLIDTMPHNRQVPTTSALFSSDGATVTQQDAHPRHQGRDEGAGTFQVPVPGGASILMKDSAGTSMSLNLDIDPSSGTPILSGRAISAQGNILDVHPCSCENPIASRHKLPLPKSPELSRGGASALDPSHLYPSPRSPLGMNRRPAPILTQAARTPLFLVQTRLPGSPSVIDIQQKTEAPVLETSAETLGSPFTPTPASVGRRSRTPSPSDTFYTSQMCPEESSAPAASNALEPLHGAPPPPNVPQTTDAPPVPLLIDLNFDVPVVRSPSPADTDRLSEISGPTTLDPLPSFPSSPSFSVSEHSNRTVMPRHLRLMTGVQQDRTTAEPTTSPAEGAVHSADDDAITGVAIDPSDRQHSNIVQCNTGSPSDLYTDRDVFGPSMPTARVGPDGRELRFDLTTQLESGPMTGRASPPRAPHHSGNIKGKWEANLTEDHMALQLDLSLDGLGLQNLSLSIPRPPTAPSTAAVPDTDPIEAEAETGPQGGGGGGGGGECDWDDAESNSSQSIMSFGSSPSTASPLNLSDLPLTPIPELLHTPTKHSMAIPGVPPPTTTTTIMLPKRRPSSRAAAAAAAPATAYAYPVEREREQRHPHSVSELPTPLDNEPILAQLMQGRDDAATIQYALCDLAKEWRNVVMMPDGVALRDVEDDCTALYHAISDLSPIIMLTWPQTRQPSLGTEGGQPWAAREQQQHFERMGEIGHKWYLKQHEFTTSLQRNLTRLTLLAQRVLEDPDAAYRGNILERISQFTAKFEDIALRLKLAHHIQLEQKWRARVRHAARRAVTSLEQTAAHEYHRARLAKVREDIEEIKHALVGSPAVT
ncbi:hypothetical protein BJV74DRAFT_989419 [Russula compacta]|nr:hypothetical protein BJV74DRAFT_989419 [Russula compacta]